MIGAGLATARMAAVIAVLFGASPAPMTAASGHGVSHTSLGRHTASNKLSRSTNLRVVDEKLRDKRLRKRRIAKIRALAGPYARMVIEASKQAHVPSRLVAAVVQVENGGDFVGSAHRVSSAGAIGVMQLEPATAWDALHVNPWDARENLEGGARFIGMMLKEFNGNVRLALMAYNAGPSLIASGVRPASAEYYATTVMRDAWGNYGSA